MLLALEKRETSESTGSFLHGGGKMGVVHLFYNNVHSQEVLVLHCCALETYKSSRIIDVHLCTHTKRTRLPWNRVCWHRSLRFALSLVVELHGLLGRDDAV